MKCPVCGSKKITTMQRNKEIIITCQKCYYQHKQQRIERFK